MDLDTRGLGCYCCLQMWSQFATASAAAALLLGCEAKQAALLDVSDPSTPSDSPDLLLHQVAFARLADGRVRARGTATELGYRRAGGRLDAQLPAATLYPEPSTGYSMFGDVQLASPHGEGDLTSKQGSASGGVQFRTARGDHGSAQSGPSTTVPPTSAWAVRMTVPTLPGSETPWR